MNWSSLKRVIMILPNMPPCGWAGLGNTGCAPNTQCNSWLQARRGGEGGQFIPIPDPGGRVVLYAIQTYPAGAGARVCGLLAADLQINTLPNTRQAPDDINIPVMFQEMMHNTGE